MKLEGIKGAYDAIFSLGDLCLASIQLRQNKLRPFAGVIDWMGSYSLSDVNRLLRYRFYDFMDQSHLRILGYAGDNLAVSEDAYHILSSHDFDIARNSLTELKTYPEVKAKLERRIQRFLDKCATCQRVLFVRTEADMEDAEELQDVLSELVTNNFQVLVVNHTGHTGIVDEGWTLEKVCAVQFPQEDKWLGNNHLWTQLLQGVHYSENLK
ncbi:DUF1796 family putative cysteine peptidase [Paenibacillus jiagnxiensis]|uniref:DUF1796 family putative cysteine peptidase n=1 Tax=Paenibacillus jiagnxiensis TaxID=3228926 RepID=UPI00339FC4A6